MYNKAQRSIIGRIAKAMIIVLLLLAALVYYGLELFVSFYGNEVKAKVIKFHTSCSTNKNTPQISVLYEGQSYRVTISGKDCERLHQGDELNVIKYPGIGLVRRNRDVSVLSAIIIIALTSWFAYMAWTGLRSGLRRAPAGTPTDQ